MHIYIMLFFILGTKLLSGQASFSADIGAQILPKGNSIYVGEKYSALNLLNPSRELGCTISYRIKSFALGVHPRFLSQQNSRIQSVTRRYTENGVQMETQINGLFYTDNHLFWLTPWTLGFKIKNHQLMGGLAVNYLLYTRESYQLTDSNRKTNQFRTDADLIRKPTLFGSLFFKYSYQFDEKFEFYLSSQFHPMNYGTNLSYFSYGIAFLTEK